MLFINKKLKWGYIRFWAFVMSLLLLSTHSFAFEGPQHRLNFHLNGFGLSGISLNSNDLQGSEGINFGISYDYVDKRGHSFAIEGHSFPLTVGSQTLGGSLLSIGYRYHTKGGFYVGLGAASVIRDTEGCPTFSTQCRAFYRSSDLGLSLGYTYVFDSGFTLGVSSIYVPPSPASKVTERGSTFNVSRVTSSTGLNLGAQSVGLVLGYTWR